MVRGMSLSIRDSRAIISLCVCLPPSTRMDAPLGRDLTAFGPLVSLGTDTAPVSSMMTEWTHEVEESANESIS